MMAVGVLERFWRDRVSGALPLRVYRRLQPSLTLRGVLPIGNEWSDPLTNLII